MGKRRAIKRKTMLCKYCNEPVTVRELETLDIHNQPIIELEVHCTPCNRSYVI